MNKGNSEPLERLAQIAAVALCYLVCLIIPFKIGSVGFLPTDDALRHAAFAVDNRTWNEVLVMDTSLSPKMDVHAGWHKILRTVHHVTGWTQDGLVFFSFAFTFSLFMLVGLTVSRAPVAWMLAAFLTYLISPGFLSRLLLGRPYVISMAVLVGLLFLWMSKKRWPWHKEMTVVIGGLTLAIFAHPTVWYLWSIPFLALGLARKYRSALILAGSVLCAMLLAATLLGDFHNIFVAPFQVILRVVGTDPIVVTNLVTELRPSGAPAAGILLMLIILALRHLKGYDLREELRCPDFWLVAIGWTAGLAITRFWLDWGLPALIVWSCRQATILIPLFPHRGKLCLAISFSVCVMFYLAGTADVNGRYTATLKDSLLRRPTTEFENKLPDTGGILYASDMGSFYSIYYRLPHDRFRFILGYEPCLMPAEDLKTLRAIQFSSGLIDEYKPWLMKMTSADRVLLRYPEKPTWPGMEFAKYYSYWIGRRIGPVDNPETERKLEGHSAGMITSSPEGIHKEGGTDL